MKSKLDEFIREQNEIIIPATLPVIPMRDGVIVFPGSVVPFLVGRKKSVRALEYAVDKTDRLLFLAWQKDPQVEEPDANDLYEIGTIAQIVQVMKNPDGTFKVLVEGLERGLLKRKLNRKSLLLFEIELVKVRYRNTKHLQALVRKIKDMVDRYVEMTQRIPKELLLPLEELDDPDRFADLVAPILPGNFMEKYDLLRTLHPKERLEKILYALSRELELLQIEAELDEKVKNKIEKTQREYYLREKLRAIKEELGAEEPDTEIAELKRRLEEGKFPDYVVSKAKAEIDRLSKMTPYSAEATVVRTYLDWIMNLPWMEETEERLDIKIARKILDEDHYGLEEVKERILEYLAVKKLSKDLKSPILCLVGPPGVGKTSLGKSLARATNRKFARMSLGGLKDEAEIRGHRRTYVGAMPGRIIQLMRQVKSRNPVLLLDEVDKMGISFQGDPSSALLEVLDPEQNKNFVDHYIELPFDLSKVMFITTANVTYSIPPALLDRMEVIEIPGYTENEKLMIAKRHLVPRLFKEHGLDELKMRITDGAIMKIIENYTKEAGVRNLERELAKLMRKIALMHTEGKLRSNTISSKNVEELLGPPKYRENKSMEGSEIGVATGMAWTSYGGVTLQIETLIFPGKGQMILTGQLGDVMKESAQIALSLARKICSKMDNLPDDFFFSNDIHIHIPEGAVPKDGPSAGITMLVSLVSAVLRKPIRKDIAMTGEITLRGRILPVGGIREKLLAALRNGLKEVIIPKGNSDDLVKIPKRSLSKLRIHKVESVEEVLKLVFEDEDKEG